MEKDNKKKYGHWSKSVNMDGKSKCLDVCEIENGFINTLTKSWTNEKGEYECICKKWYTKNNPLVKENDEEEKSTLDELEGTEPMFDTY